MEARVTDLHLSSSSSAPLIIINNILINTFKDLEKKLQANLFSCRGNWLIFVSLTMPWLESPLLKRPSNTFFGYTLFSVYIWYFKYSHCIPFNVKYRPYPDLEDTLVFVAVSYIPTKAKKIDTNSFFSKIEDISSYATMFFLRTIYQRKCFSRKLLYRWINFSKFYFY